MMDSEARARGDENVSTPGEAALLMQALYEMKFGKAVCEEILDILRKPKNGGFNSVLPADVPIAFKPGGIPGVKTEWALVELPERPYVAVFMESYDRHNEADEILKSISRILYDYFWRLGNASDYGTFVDPKMIP
jgi:beta-lactamase class A